MPAGHVRALRLTSAALRGNALGDPLERDIAVYEPHDLDASPPSIGLIALAGFTGSGPMLFNTDALSEGLAQRLDRLIETGACPRVVVAAPDCFTRLGGNQYIDSPAIGSYATYLTREVVPFLSKRYGVERWGVFGKSSGGYAAIVLGMLHPETFAALADHSGDSNFELCYTLDAGTALDQFRMAGGPAEWLARYWSKPDGRRAGAAVKTLNFLAMSASYSPNPKSKHLGIDFPFDLDTGRFVPEVWARWQAWDPVRMVESHVEALSKMEALFIDAGTRDEYSLHWGARALSKELKARGIQHVFEEFDDGHMNIQYRFDRSIPLLCRALLAGVEK